MIEFDFLVNADKKFDIETQENLEFEFNTGDASEQYVGIYEVIPDKNSITLETANKLMKRNVLVEAVPTYIVSNTSGGTTFVIG